MGSSTFEWVTLCKLPKGTHTVRLVKLSEYGTVHTECIKLPDNAKLGTPPAAKQRKIHFIGDSCTAGFKDDRATAKENTFFLSKEENANMTFAARAARSLNAEYNVFAVSGGTTQDVIDRYLQLDFSRYGGAPDVIFIALGVNDVWKPTWTEKSKTYTAQYTAYLKQIYQKAPSATILAAYGIWTADAQLEPLIGEAVQQRRVKAPPRPGMERYARKQT